jgi:hypothetical protein
LQDPQKFAQKTNFWFENKPSHLATLDWTKVMIIYTHIFTKKMGKKWRFWLNLKTFN